MTAIPKRNLPLATTSQHYMFFHGGGGLRHGLKVRKPMRFRAGTGKGDEKATEGRKDEGKRSEHGNPVNQTPVLDSPMPVLG